MVGKAQAAAKPYTDAAAAKANELAEQLEVSIGLLLRSELIQSGRR